MRKYILVVLTFMMFACTLGQRQAKRSTSAPTNAPVSVPTVATAAPTNPQATTATPESNQMSRSGNGPSGSPLSPPTIPQKGAYLGAWVNPAKDTNGGGGDFVSQLPQFQSDLGDKLPGILNFYADFLSPVPLSDLQAIEAKGSIPFISWGGKGSCPSDYDSAILSGQYDQQITQYAEWS